MCQFVSWIETADGKIYFLSDKELRHPKGKATREYCQNDDDLKGHGAIRHYYRLKNHDGNNKECEDFSTPNNFPAMIAEAIKSGNMTMFGVQPEGLLTKKAYKAYQEARATADKAYQEARAPAYKAYQEARATADKAYQEARAPAYKAYQEASAPADKAYQEARATAYKAYQEASAPADKAYQEARATAFWSLFANAGNRNTKWR
jgi:hypothetical protein